MKSHKVPSNLLNTEREGQEEPGAAQSKQAKIEHGRKLKQTRESESDKRYQPMIPLDEWRASCFSFMIYPSPQANRPPVSLPILYNRLPRMRHNLPRPILWPRYSDQTGRAVRLNEAEFPVGCVPVLRRLFSLTRRNAFDRRRE